MEQVERDFIKIKNLYDKLKDNGFSLPKYNLSSKYTKKLNMIIYSKAEEIEKHLRLYFNGEISEMDDVILCDYTKPKYYIGVLDTDFYDNYVYPDTVPMRNIYKVIGNFINTFFINLKKEQELSPIKDEYMNEIMNFFSDYKVITTFPYIEYKIPTEKPLEITNMSFDDLYYNYHSDDIDDKDHNIFIEHVRGLYYKRYSLKKFFTSLDIVKRNIIIDLILDKLFNSDIYDELLIFIFGEIYDLLIAIFDDIYIFMEEKHKFETCKSFYNNLSNIYESIKLYDNDCVDDDKFKKFNIKNNVDKYNTYLIEKFKTYENEEYMNAYDKFIKKIDL